MKNYSKLSLAAAALMAAAVSLNASTLYWGGGTSNIANDTAIPTTGTAQEGTWNVSLQNWASDPYVPNTYGTWVDGSFALLGRRADNVPVDLDITLENNISASGLMNNNQVSPGFNVLTDITAVAPVTIDTGTGDLFTVRTVANASTSGLRLLSDVTLTGSSLLWKDGLGEFRLTGDSDAFTGDMVVSGGIINFSSSSSQVGVTAIELSGYAPSMTDWGRSGNSGWINGALTANNSFGTNDRLSDDLAVTLTRGNFDYRHNNAVSTETIGKIVLAPGGVFTSSQGATGGTLTLSDATEGINRSATGTLIVNSDNSGIVRSNIVMTNTGTLALDTLLPWMPINYGTYMYIDSADNNTLKTLAATDADTDLSVWDTTYSSTDIVRVISPVPTNTIDANTTIRALTFSTGVNTNVSYTLDPGVVLNVAAGAISKQGSGNNATTLTGGDITTSASHFFISTGSSNTSQIILESRLTGTYDLVKFGIVNLTLGGDDANTFAGDVYVNEGRLTLNKTEVEGVAPAAINGDVFVETGGGLFVQTNGSLPSTSSVFLADMGLLQVEGITYGGVITSNGGQICFNNKFPIFDNAGYGLVLNGGLFQHNSTSTGGLSLQTNVKYESTASQQTRFERYSTGAFNIELDGAERTFDIANSATLPAGVAEMVIDTTIVDGSAAGGSLLKTGSGVLQLTDANTYTGGTTVAQGTLQLATISAPAQAGLLITTANSGNLSNILTFDKPIANSGDFIVGQTVSGLPSARRITGVLNDWQIIVNGNSSTNTYTVSVDAVSRTGSLNGPVTVNSGAAFGGTGVVDGASTESSALTMDSGAKFAFQLDGSGGASDQIDLWNYVAGDLVLNGNAIDLSLSGTPVDGTYTVEIIRCFSDDGTTATASGISTGIGTPNLPSGIASASVIYGTNSISIQYTVGSGGPEPLVPVLSIVTSGANLIITCPSESGFSYALESSNDLGASDPWGSVETKSGTGSDLTFTVAAPSAGNEEFYRVVVN